MSNRTLVHAERLGAYRIEIHVDEHAENPRTTHDTLGTLALVGNRIWDGEETVTQDEVADLLARDDVAALPVYIYSHSGVRFSTKPFGDRWDSGRAGCIYAVTADAMSKYGFKDADAVRAALQSEVEELDAYVSGNNYGFIVRRAHEDDRDDAAGAGDEVASCWRFTCEATGYVLEQARESAAHYDAEYRAKSLAVVRDVARFHGVDIG